MITHREDGYAENMFRKLNVYRKENRMIDITIVVEVIYFYDISNLSNPHLRKFNGNFYESEKFLWSRVLELNSCLISSIHIKEEI